MITFVKTDMMQKKQLIIIGVLLIIVLAPIYFFRIEKKTIHCKVKQHHVIGNKIGESIYYTLLSCDDGKITEKKGLYYYSMPIGSRTTISFNVLKLKQYE